MACAHREAVAALDEAASIASLDSPIVWGKALEALSAFYSFGPPSLAADEFLHSLDRQLRGLIAEVGWPIGGWGLALRLPGCTRLLLHRVLSQSAKSVDRRPLVPTRSTCLSSSMLATRRAWLPSC